MKTPNIYPFTIYAADIHFAESPRLAVTLWNRHRKPGQTWYAADLEVRGPDVVRVHVRDMADSFSGGIGEVIHTLEPPLTADDLAELRSLIAKRQTKWAADEFARREQQRIADQIEAVRRELFDAA